MSRSKTHSTLGEKTDNIDIVATNSSFSNTSATESSNLLNIRTGNGISGSVTVDNNVFVSSVRSGGALKVGSVPTDAHLPVDGINPPYRKPLLVRE